MFEANNLPNDVQNLTGSTAEIYKIVGDLGRLAEGLLCDYRLVAYCFGDLTMNPSFCLLSVIFFAVIHLLVCRCFLNISTLIML